MRKNAVRFHFGANEAVAEVVFGGKTTRIDLAGYNRNDRSKLAIALWDWARNGYQGYPVLS